MSLFENDEYQWRETYFIFFREKQRPDAKEVETMLNEMDSRYLISGVRADENGKLESLTLISPDDYAAMDISFVSGDEVAEQMPGLVKELRSTAEEEELPRIDEIQSCKCRFDIFHFEQLVFVGKSQDDDEEFFMDPGSLLVVMETLADVCGGVVVDPQANTLL